MGVSEQCPDNNHKIFNDAVYTVDDGPVIGNSQYNPSSQQNIRNLTEKSYEGNLPLIVLAVLISSIGGFLVIMY